jgi:hypothetical protein
VGLNSLKSLNLTNVYPNNNNNNNNNNNKNNNKVKSKPLGASLAGKKGMYVDFRELYKKNQSDNLPILNDIPII